MTDEMELARREIGELIASGEIGVHFQAIVDLGRSAIVGYEALARGRAGSPLHSPLDLFDAAARTGQLVELERCVLRTVGRRFRDLHLPGLLFVNVTADMLTSRSAGQADLHQILSGFDIAASRIVVELTETRAPQSEEALLRSIEDIRALGCAIALDDLGEGFASLKRWSLIRPNFVKIDRHFVDGLARDPMKLQFMKSMVELASSCGSVIIAEGLEDESDLVVLRTLAVPLGQGYLFGKPAARPRDSLTPEANRILQNHEGRGVMAASTSTTSAGQLAKTTLTVREDTTCAQVIALFHNNPNLYALPVLDANGIPVGLLRSPDTMRRASERFFHELFGKRPCTAIMDRNPPVFDVATTLREMAETIVGNDERYLLDGFIVTLKGQYVGVGRITDLLKAVSDQQIVAARHANPLTLLPGNVPIGEQISALLHGGRSFVVAYWDLNNFKPYNDVYGYHAGDSVIRFTANQLNAVIDPQIDFLGHVGGDDFVMLLSGNDWEQQVAKAIASFDCGIDDFFGEQHRLAGGYATQNRQGIQVFHPLVTLAAGIVIVGPRNYENHAQVAEAASLAKSEAKKKLAGSGYFIEPRNRAEMHKE